MRGCLLVVVAIGAVHTGAWASSVSSLVQGEWTGGEGDRASVELTKIRLKFDEDVGKAADVRVHVGLESGEFEVRDAYVDLELVDDVELRLGQFKRPFSLEALTGSGSLPLSTRGIVNDLFSDGDQGYAGRDRGARFRWTVDGEVRRLRIEAAILDGAGIDRVGAVRSSQWVLRVEARVRDGWELGVSGIAQAADEIMPLGRAWGIDASITTDRYELLTEGLFGWNRVYGDDVTMDGVTASGKWIIDRWEPGVRLERVDPHRSLIGDAEWAVTPQVAYRFRRGVRMYFQVMRLFPATGDPETVWSMAWRAFS